MCVETLLLPYTFESRALQNMGRDPPYRAKKGHFAFKRNVPGVGSMTLL